MQNVWPASLRLQVPGVLAGADVVLEGLQLLGLAGGVEARVLRPQVLRQHLGGAQALERPARPEREALVECEAGVALEDRRRGAGGADSAALY